MTPALPSGDCWITIPPARSDLRGDGVPGTYEAPTGYNAPPDALGWGTAGPVVTVDDTGRPGDVTLHLAAFVADLLPAVFAAARQDPQLSAALARIRIGNRPLAVEAIATALTRDAFREACRMPVTAQVAVWMAEQLRGAAVASLAAAGTTTTTTTTPTTTTTTTTTTAAAAPVAAGGVA